MDRLITATEANQRFSEVLRHVAEGETFTVTSRGKPVARVTPITKADERRAKIDRLLHYVKGLDPVHGKPWKREDLYD